MAKEKGEPRKPPTRTRTPLVSQEVGVFRIVVLIKKGIPAESVKALCKANAEFIGDMTKRLVEQQGM